MSFVKYSSIENTYQERYIQKIYKEKRNECNWLVFEKIDGSNFSFIYDGVEMKFARRNAILVSGEAFFDYSGISAKYSQHIVDFYNRLRLDEGASVHVFGELYGGHYPGVRSTGKPINKNVFYAPEIDFAIFDVFVKEDETRGRWMAYREYSHLLENVPVLEPLFEGGFEDALKYPNRFITTIPKLHRLPDIPGNYAEGVVIKPSIPQHFSSGERVALKNKIEEFSEKRERPPKDVTTPTHPIEIYITEQRLHNVVSKIGEVTMKDFGKIMKDYAADILEDYKKEHELDDKEEKIAKKIIGGNAPSMVRRYIELGTSPRIVYPTADGEPPR